MFGLVYVFFGHKGPFPDIDLSSSTPYRGFSIVGTQMTSDFGNAISSAGDFDNDGFDDFMIGEVITLNFF